MTLNDIIVSALAQLDRGRDSQTVDTWRDRFTRYANEAVIDIATKLKLRRTDTLQVTSGRANLDDLPNICVKVIKVTKGGADIPFTSGSASMVLSVLADDGAVDVQYRFLPNDMSSPTDVPEVPEYTHGMIVNYVVARERASADPSMQRGASVYFEMYNSAKSKLRPDHGEADGFQIINRW